MSRLNGGGKIGLTLDSGASDSSGVEARDRVRPEEASPVRRLERRRGCFVADLEWIPPVSERHLIHAFVTRVAERRPESPFLVEEGVERSYGDLEAASNRISEEPT